MKKTQFLLSLILSVTLAQATQAASPSSSIKISELAENLRQLISIPVSGASEETVRFKFQGMVGAIFSLDRTCAGSAVTWQRLELLQDLHPVAMERALSRAEGYLYGSRNGEIAVSQLRVIREDLCTLLASAR